MLCSLSYESGRFLSMHYQRDSEQVVVKVSHFLGEENKTVQKAGRTLAFYIPKQAKQYVGPGDVFKVSTRIVKGEMEIVAKRKIFNFDLNDVKVFAEKRGLKVKYDDEVEGTRIVDATNDQISLKSMQSKLEQPYGLVHVVLSGKLLALRPQKYQEGKTLVESFKSKLNISFLPEGDANTVKLLEHPEYYLKDGSDIFKRLDKTGKKVDASITARLDNRKNDMNDLGEAIQLTVKLEDTIGK